jgi:hypothetical protein
MDSHINVDVAKVSAEEFSQRCRTDQEHYSRQTFPCEAGFLAPTRTGYGANDNKINAMIEPGR